MTTDAPDGRADPIDVIFKSLDDAMWGRRNLPRLVSLLTHESNRVRLGAGWAITYVAEEESDSATYLVRRLGDRMTDDEVPLAVEQTFLAVAARYPDVVSAELPDLFDADQERSGSLPVGGAMLRAEYGLGSNRNRDIGRVRMPRGGGAGDEQQIFTDDDIDGEPADAASGDDPAWAIGGAGAGDEGDAAGESGGDEDATDDGGGTGRRLRPARELWAQTNHLAVIAANCRFDDLAVMAERHRDRYADVYRTRADLDGEELAVGLLLFHEPPDDHEAYINDLDEALANWYRVDDVEGIRTLYDWGRQPRPWALVEYAREDLGDRSRLFSDTAVWNARHLAVSLAHVHENGVVHAGVDPGNVSYYGDLLETEDRQVPMLTNVGLLSVIRQYFDPTSRLDPRYAAPEYFDRRFGRIDHASDIYGLGAVCFHLFTGRPPYHGDYASIRDAVLSPTTPEPSAVADVPEGVDEIVAKAMAPDKLHRYEGVTHMAADLRALADDDAADELLEPRAGDSTSEDESAAETAATTAGETAAEHQSTVDNGSTAAESAGGDDAGDDGDSVAETPDTDDRSPSPDRTDSRGTAESGDSTGVVEEDGSTTDDVAPDVSEESPEADG